jgi:hypothetical protein
MIKGTCGRADGFLPLVQTFTAMPVYVHLCVVVVEVDLIELLGNG